ncbi:hypothetical protein QR680_007961 [Steinernema hermaphroditum]|uniref:Uncharacterized protein n=1 Tax=Steinernema hermaphroditum TaxID=289476 RepID=A0AA39IGE5_9BILA|nr:hypothetical protein QR680_007961 [Steinernema hermaphroditum]
MSQRVFASADDRIVIAYALCINDDSHNPRRTEFIEMIRALHPPVVEQRAREIFNQMNRLQWPDRRRRIFAAMSGLASGMERTPRRHR